MSPPELASRPHRLAVQANRLLAVMPKDALDRLTPAMEGVELTSGKQINGPDGKLEHAYFPTSLIVTVLVPAGDGNFTKVAMIGREGMVGIASLMGNATPLRRAVVLNTGNAFRIPLSALRAEFDRKDVVMRLILRFAQTLITQMAQTVVCNRHHHVEPQLCGLLLACMDRLPTGNSLPVTQELIAGLLGVRREGVSEAAGKLRQSGLIDFRRGRISLLDRPGLLLRACECYEVVKRETDRLLPDRPAT